VFFTALILKHNGVKENDGIQRVLEFSVYLKKIGRLGFKCVDLLVASGSVKLGLWILAEHASEL